MFRSKFFLAVMMLCFSYSALQADQISEFEPNPDGTDPAMQTIEISGTPGGSFSLTFLTIEAEGGTAVTPIGVIDSANTVMGLFDSNGLATFVIPDIENPAYTAMLVTGFTGMVGDDLDTNDDGTLDSMPWTSICDSLNVPDGGSAGSGDVFYGSAGTSVPPAGFDDEPISVFRDSVNGDWYSIHEDDPGTGTYFVFDDTAVMIPGSAFNIDPMVNTSTFGMLNPTTQGGILLGDVNCDGVVDLLDVAPFVAILTSGGFDPKADINQDGQVTLTDVAPFVALLTGG